MISRPNLAKLEAWLIAPAEVEQLEFKLATTQYDTEKSIKYCAAIANEGGGYLVLGVSDVPPRKVEGTKAFSSTTSINSVKSKIRHKLGIRVDLVELRHADGRVLVFCIPSRPTGQAIQVDGAYLMRSGEELVAMTSDTLKRIFAEDRADWFTEPAMGGLSDAEVIKHLNTQTYFELLGRPYPTSQAGVLDHLAIERFINRNADGWSISNLGAILLAKRLEVFPPHIARKATRFVVYEGINKLKTKQDIPGTKGIAVGFSGLVKLVHSSASQNHLIEEAIREEVKMFPPQALRELIANALVHQDFEETGVSVMIEMYSDRIEISNPGIPPIAVERFIDENKSRNEHLADVMRRLGICEEKGSGIDKVIHAAEIFQLPPPDFRVDDIRTTAVLFAHQEFADMSKAERIRACYQHCVLLHVGYEKMSNKSLRGRFGLDDSPSSSAIASQVIKDTKDGGLIKADDGESNSTRYARYLPFWA